MGPSVIAVYSSNTTLDDGIRKETAPAAWNLLEPRRPWRAHWTRICVVMPSLSARRLYACEAISFSLFGAPSPRFASPRFSLFLVIHRRPCSVLYYGRSAHQSGLRRRFRDGRSRGAAPPTSAPQVSGDCRPPPAFEDRPMQSREGASKEKSRHWFCGARGGVDSAARSGARHARSPAVPQVAATPLEAAQWIDCQRRARVGGTPLSLHCP
ncbi:hypothetical protein C8T65DRAFT_269111 [Cerioporus squamosus]|nr:hypothetical protein C8T65DRAFT_269111 [Cerioporus squamosus]